MEDSTSRATTPGKPASGAPNAWRRFRQRISSFLESVGEIRHGMDEARHVHPTISAHHDDRRH